MNLIKHQAKLALPLLALIFIACSPQRKVQQYSYLVKHKDADDLVATNHSYDDPNMRPPISTSSKEEILIKGKHAPKTPVRKKYTPQKTEAPQNPPIGQTAVRKEHLIANSGHMDTYPPTSSAYNQEEPVGQTAVRKEQWVSKTSNTYEYTDAKTADRKDPLLDHGSEPKKTPIGQTDVRKDNLISRPQVKTKDPISKTEVKEPIDVSLIEAPKVSMPTSSPMIIKLRKEEVRKIVSTADRFMGTPYKYGGMNGQGIDCSGLICEAYGAADIILPRSSWGMAKSGQQIPVEQVAPGHLLFFHSYKGKGINHVAMVSKVTGKEIEFIHATVNNGVRKDKLSDPYWTERFRMAVVPTNTQNKSTAP